MPTEIAATWSMSGLAAMALRSQLFLARVRQLRNAGLEGRRVPPPAWITSAVEAAHGAVTPGFQVSPCKQRADPSSMRWIS